MHYYTRHIGDYAKDTGHLSLLEHGIYTVLLDWSYATERTLPDEKEAIYRICRAQNASEKKSVDKVVAEFFPKRQDGCFNKRVSMEISAFQRKSDSARKANEVRWHSERTPNGLHSDSERSPTRARVPLTNNQYPITKREEEALSPDVPESSFPEVSIPSIADVRAWATASGRVDPDWAERKWKMTTGNNGWQRNGRLIGWKQLWIVWFEEDVRAGKWKKTGEKNSAGQSDGMSVAQRRYLLDKELDLAKGAFEAKKQIGMDYREELAEVNRLLAELEKLGGAA